MSRFGGPILIAVAASLWATDALFRFPVVNRINPVLLVLIEHLVSLAVLGGVYLAKRRSQPPVRPKEWAALALIGAGASAAATVLFTASFRYINPSVAILLQKLQPVLAVLFAMIFLGERPPRAFFPWAAVALVSGLVVSFPDLDFAFLGGFSPESKGVAFAVVASGLWAGAIVAGKALLGRLPPLAVTFWRYVFGALTLGLLAASGGAANELTGLGDRDILLPILYMGLVPGLVAVYLYYVGLNRTRASIAAFVELVFPVSAVILNTLILGLPLHPVQIGASVVLLGSVTAISINAWKSG